MALNDPQKLICHQTKNPKLNIIISILSHARNNHINSFILNLKSSVSFTIVFLLFLNKFFFHPVEGKWQNDKNTYWKSVHQSKPSGENKLSWKSALKVFSFSWVLLLNLKTGLNTITLIQPKGNYLFLSINVYINRYNEWKCFYIRWNYVLHWWCSVSDEYNWSGQTSTA